MFPNCQPSYSPYYQSNYILDYQPNSFSTFCYTPCQPIICDPCSCFSCQSTYIYKPLKPHNKLPDNLPDKFLDKFADKVLNKVSGKISDNISVKVSDKVSKMPKAKNYSETAAKTQKKKVTKGRKQNKKTADSCTQIPKSRSEMRSNLNINNKKFGFKSSDGGYCGHQCVSPSLKGYAGRSKMDFTLLTRNDEPILQTYPGPTYAVNRVNSTRSGQTDSLANFKRVPQYSRSSPDRKFTGLQCSSGSSIEQQPVQRKLYASPHNPPIKGNGKPTSKSSPKSSGYMLPMVKVSNGSKCKCSCIRCIRSSAAQSPSKIPRKPFSSTRSCPQLDVINEEEYETSEPHPSYGADASAKQSKIQKSLEDSCADFLNIVCDNILESVQKSVDLKLKEFLESNTRDFQLLFKKIEEGQSNMKNLCQDVVEKINGQNENNFNEVFSRLQQLERSIEGLTNKIDRTNDDQKCCNCDCLACDETQQKTNKDGSANESQDELQMKLKKELEEKDLLPNVLRPRKSLSGSNLEEKRSKNFIASQKKRKAGGFADSSKQPTVIDEQASRNMTTSLVVIDEPASQNIGPEKSLAFPFVINKPTLDNLSHRIFNKPVSEEEDPTEKHLLTPIIFKKTTSGNTGPPGKCFPSSTVLNKPASGTRPSNINFLPSVRGSAIKRESISSQKSSTNMFYKQNGSNRENLKVTTMPTKQDSPEITKPKASTSRESASQKEKNPMEKNLQIPVIIKKSTFGNTGPPGKYFPSPAVLNKPASESIVPPTSNIDFLPSVRGLTIKKESIISRKSSINMFYKQNDSNWEDLKVTTMPTKQDSSEITKPRTITPRESGSQKEFISPNIKSTGFILKKESLKIPSFSENTFPPDDSDSTQPQTDRSLTSFDCVETQSEEGTPLEPTISDSSSQSEGASFYDKVESCIQLITFDCLKEDIKTRESSLELVLQSESDSKAQQSPLVVNEDEVNVCREEIFKVEINPKCQPLVTDISSVPSPKESTVKGEKFPKNVENLGIKISKSSWNQEVKKESAVTKLPSNSPCPSSRYLAPQREISSSQNSSPKSQLKKNKNLSGKEEAPSSLPLSQRENTLKNDPELLSINSISKTTVKEEATAEKRSPLLTSFSKNDSLISRYTTFRLSSTGKSIYNSKEIKYPPAIADKDFNSYIDSNSRLLSDQYDTSGYASEPEDSSGRARNNSARKKLQKKASKPHCNAQPGSLTHSAVTNSELKSNSSMTRLSRL